MSDKLVRLDKNGEVITITLDNPPVNAVSTKVLNALNAATVVSEGRVLETYAKRELPNYQVFDERRYFTPGRGTCQSAVTCPALWLPIYNTRSDSPTVRLAHAR